MTINKINKEMEKAMKKYELAKAIREMLDAARKEYGPQAWDDDELEMHIQELVFEE